MKIFIFFNILLITLTIYFTFNLKNYYLEKKGNEKITFKEFINNGSLPTFKNIIIGLSFGITFGFIDNIALWFGIDTLEKYMPGGVLTKSALGNTYSNVLGVIIGTCISIAAKNIMSVEFYQEPIWLNTLGILIGCLLGMLTGILISNKN
tara:strand:- start:2131 stop:2580 length:450 start_codon:yes stop_codon:yes gene_type:complete